MTDKANNKLRKPDIVIEDVAVETFDGKKLNFKGLIGIQKIECKEGN